MLRFLQLFFGSFLLLPAARGAHNVTVCDCTTGHSMGMIRFDDGNCETKPNGTVIPPKLMDYKVYTTRRESEKFQAWMCSSWIKETSITTLPSFYQIRESKSTPVDTTRAQCWTMIEKKRCVDGPSMVMTNDNRWQHMGDAPVSWFWLLTKTDTIPNCMLESINITKMENGELLTPFGLANETDGFVTRNHVTIVWNRAKVESQCNVRLLEQGVASFSSTKDGKMVRIVDTDNQLDFHAVPAQRCPCGTPCTLHDLYSVVGNDDITISLSTLTNGERASLGTLNLPRFKLEVNTAAHLQFIRDEEIEHENQLAHLLKTLSCRERHHFHQLVTSTAQYNGWLAASHLGLPRCQKLIGLGDTLAVFQCLPVDASFDAVTTKCGPQPKFKNFTINTDGWELVPYSPCYWSGNFVNFQGQPHHLENGNWVPSKVQSIKPNDAVIPMFKYDNDDLFQIEDNITKAYSDVPTSHMNVMADVLAALQEHQGSYDGSHSVFDFKEVSPGNILSNLFSSAARFRDIWWYIEVILIVAGVIGCIWLLKVAGFFRCLRSTCKCRRKRRRRPSEYELREIVHHLPASTMTQAPLLQHPPQRQLLSS